MQNKNKATDAPLTPNFRLQQNSIQFPELLDGDMEPFLKFIVQMDTCMLVNNKTFSNKLKVMFLTTCLKGPVLQWLQEIRMSLPLLSYRNAGIPCTCAKCLVLCWLWGVKLRPSC
uniref:DUF4939 domain-containing protein n=1 Tax=Peromyscus maniculatus bairdii TaxID=230844 RepID=A0A8C8UGH3_PERMB